MVDMVDIVDIGVNRDSVAVVQDKD